MRSHSNQPQNHSFSPELRPRTLASERLPQGSKIYLSPPVMTEQEGFTQNSGQSAGTPTLLGRWSALMTAAPPPESCD